MVTPFGVVLVVGSAAAGLGSAWLVWYLARYRDRPGVAVLMVQLSIQALFCAVYVAALFVFDSTWRLHLEALVWLSFGWIPPLFFVFSLAYTGRKSLLDSPLVRFSVAAPIALTVLTLTHPFHDLLWTNATVVPRFGLATLSMEIQPVGLLGLLSLTLFTAIAVFFLVDAVIDYGPLYRREAAAVAVSTLPPTVGFFHWVFDLDPLSTINFVPLLFLPHVLLDAYAFVGKNMFDSSPTTMRAAQRHAIDELPLPIFVLDPSDRLVDYNHAASRLLPPTIERGTSRLAAVLPVTFDEDREPDPRIQEISVPGRQRSRQFSISATTLRGPRGESVGRLLVFQDLTTELERQQQLEVLNRLLRHNLRNEMTVVMGAADVIGAELTDPDLQSWLETLQESGQALVDIGHRAREFGRLREHEIDLQPVSLRAVLEPAWATASQAGESTLEVESLDDATLLSDAHVLEVVLANLLENAIVHSDETAPTVWIRTERAGDTLELAIEDEGPGLPADELTVLEQATETDLEHGSGLGLWLVTWGLDRVGGDVRFDRTDRGTVATVSLPLAAE